jgi:hypothetical protein
LGDTTDHPLDVLESREIPASASSSVEKSFFSVVNEILMTMRLSMTSDIETSATPEVLYFAPPKINIASLFHGAVHHC